MNEYSLHGFDFINKTGDSQEFRASYLKNKRDAKRFHEYTVLQKNTTCQILSIDNTTKGYVTLKCLKHGTVNTTQISTAKKHLSCNMCVNEERESKIEETRNKLALKIKDSLPPHLTLIPSQPFSDEGTSTILCEIHGYSPVSNRGLKRSPYGCPRCGKVGAGKGRFERSKRAFQTFIDSVDTYDYSLVEYVGARDNVKIICHEHGVFEQQPAVHIKGHGCPKCGVLRADKIKLDKGYGNNFGRSGYSKTKGTSFLYVLKIVSNEEIFYKIGISKNVVSRMKMITKEVPIYICSVMFSSPFDSASAWDIEKVLHFDHNFVRYVPNNKFVGSTECFSTVDLDNIAKLCKCCL